MVCEARLLYNLYGRWLFENKVGNEGSRNFISSAHRWATLSTPFDMKSPSIFKRVLQSLAK